MVRSVVQQPVERTVIALDQFGPPSVLTARTETIPQPGAGDVLIAVAACGVNFADTMVRRGEYRRDQRLPTVPGMEVAGTVVQAPRGSSLEPGTPVVAFLEDGGGYSDYVTQRSDLVFPVPATTNLGTAAALFLQGISAWYAVHRYGQTRPGQTVLVTAAAGGLGGLAVQIARAAGAQVIGTASTQDKRAEAVRLGCVEALDITDPAFRRTVLDATAGVGVHVIVDGVGGQVFETALSCLAHNGRFVVAGSASQQPGNLDTRRLMPRGQMVCGFIVRRVIDSDPAEPAAALAHVLELAARGALDARSEHRPLTDAAAVHTEIEQRRLVGKICLIP